VEGRIEANAKQTALLGEIRRLLSDNGTGGKAKAELISVTLAEDHAQSHSEVAAKPGSHRRPRDHRRTRASP
jgi:hypothetical protein